MAIVFPGIENSKTKAAHNSCYTQSSYSSEKVAQFQMEAEARVVHSDYFSLYHCFSLNACSNDLLKATALVHCFEVQPVFKAPLPSVSHVVSLSSLVLIINIIAMHPYFLLNLITENVIAL